MVGIASNSSLRPGWKLVVLDDSVVIGYNIHKNNLS